MGLSTQRAVGKPSKILRRRLAMAKIFSPTIPKFGAEQNNQVPRPAQWSHNRYTYPNICYSRPAPEALANLHQPREQTVRHVHVNEGGQAVIADQFHHHAGGHQNAESAEQPHAAGTGAAGSGPAMLGHDAQGNGLPIPVDQGGEAMPNARRQGQQRT